ncbi:bifunctional metallophosphatase/5'-nucleotidase [Prauserella sp. PE36]|nr:bifunctional metallophosphatase/5'-nucleotidase [Prauserella sp. PE36]
MPRPRLPRLTAALSAAVLLGTLTPAATAEPLASTVPVQLLSITDLHGYFGEYTATVRPTAGAPAETVGGGAYLATHLDRLREGERNSILFSAGDDFSGWPDETEWFWNEPTVEYLNRIGLDFSTVGNHEMDRGIEFLRHMMDGTCEGRPDDDLCFTDSTGRRFRGADYEYYSANMVREHTASPVVRPYHVEYVDAGGGRKLPVGFVHTTTSLTSSEQMSYTPRGIEYLPEAGPINAYAKILRRQGVSAIVAVVHEGFSQRGGAGYNDCDSPSGPVVELNEQIDPAVDAIVTGHWHAQVNCMLPDPAGNPRPVVEAGDAGKLINEIELRLDARTGEVVRELTRSVNHPNTRDVPPDPEILGMTAYWKERLAERANTPVATVTEDLTRTRDAAGESSLYNLTADAFLWAARRDGRADLAVAMPDILRRDVTHAAAAGSPADADGRVLFSELAVGTVYDSGIGVGLVRGSVKGRQVDELIESQWQRAADGSVTFRPLAFSGNVRYTYDLAKPVGSRVDPGDVRLDGRPLRPNADYRIATLANNFFAKNATPSFTALFTARNQDRSSFNGGDALWRYLEARSPVSAPEPGRMAPAS